MSGPARPRVLLTEGGSTSAREAITALALSGHAVSYCDPAALSLGRFSRLVTERITCPPMGSDPAGFRDALLDLVRSGRFDVLLPIHEQGYLLAKVAQNFLPHVALALPAFESYARLHAKSTFAGLLREIGLAQPPGELIDGWNDPANRRPSLEAYPYLLKTDIGTASRGTWLVRDGFERERALAEIAQATPPDAPILRQDFVDAPFEQAQAVFQDSRLVGFHATRRLVEGGGGGAALKVSVARPRVADDFARIGEALAWHGGLSIDYLYEEATGRPLYIDGNPRLVEPMAATLAGADLAGLLVRVSLGERITGCLTGRPDVRTRLALQALLGAAMRQRTRAAVLASARDLALQRGDFAAAREELSPVRHDPPSLLPLLGAGLTLLVQPSRAEDLARRGWGGHLLTPQAAVAIRAMDPNLTQT